MSVVESITSATSTAFSFEILPPLKGNSLDSVMNTIDVLREFDPKYINITTHRSEHVWAWNADGSSKVVSRRRRPGTVAVAAAIHHKYNIPVVPHILCGGFTREETEYVLIDLQFLGITDLLLLRGDKAAEEKYYLPTPNGNAYAVDLQQQVNDFNRGIFEDGSLMSNSVLPFRYGMACYPEMHEDAASLENDLYWAKKKVDSGAEYLVTQMFFDNQKYFTFVEKCREMGITVPIIPGLKPLRKASQIDVLPKMFHIEIPEALAVEMKKCTTEEQSVEVGVEWCTMQAKELKAKGVPSIHFYALNAAQSVKRVAQNVY